jgi:hypothetical protein
VSSTVPRAVKAREVLGWCRYGHRSDPTGLEWVLTWAGTIALLRAVGHALLKEDDARVKKAQHSWLNTLKATEPKPSIFFDFIKHDRDMLLKERFELTVVHDVTFIPPTAGTIPAPPPTPPIYTYKMKSGCYAGRDPRNLVKEAIEWWEKQLDDIEQKAAESSL